MAQTQKFTPTERRNWGYWDGIADRNRGKSPAWASAWQYHAAHPIDKAYGEGYWAGYDGKQHPNTRAA